MKPKTESKRVPVDLDRDAPKSAPVFGESPRATRSDEATAVVGMSAAQMRERTLGVATARAFADLGADEQADALKRYVATGGGVPLNTLRQIVREHLIAKGHRDVPEVVG